MNADWIKSWITEAKAKHASIPEGVIDSIEQLLAGPAAEKEMKGSELNAVSARLLEAMGAARKKAEK